MFLEGVITQRGDCRATQTPQYMNLKKYVFLNYTPMVIIARKYNVLESDGKIFRTDLSFLSYILFPEVDKVAQGLGYSYVLYLNPSFTAFIIL